MSDPRPPDAQPSPEPEARLRAAVAAFPAPGFAVVDGGHFEDLPALFRRERLFARSLFLDTADPAVQAAGPWLVALDQAPDAVDRVFPLVGDTPAAVFWCCDQGERVLWRHLRTLNMALIPRWAAEGGSAPLADGSGQDAKAVIFRHWDPRVLAALMPCLDAGQFARVLGPAQEIALVSPEFGGCRRIARQDNWPPPPSGLLTVRSEQILSLGVRRDAARHVRMAAYLRDAAMAETAAMSDADLHALVLRYEQSARGMRLTNERSQSIWCYLMVSSAGRFEHLPKVRAYLTTGPGDPDEKVEQLLTQMVRLARTRREIG